MFTRLVQPSALAEANSCTRLAPLRRPVQRARCRALFSGARSGIGTGILRPRFSPMFVVFRIWNLPVPFSFSPWLRASAPQVGRPFAFRLTTFASSFLALLCCCPGEFLLELLHCLSFESRLSFEEPPRFLFHLLETFFIFGARFPVVSTSPQLLTLLTRELLPHRSFIVPCCLDEEVECLVSQGCCFLGSRG